MTALTPDEARAYTCPIARVSGQEPPLARCQADACILWRWLPLSADDPRFVGAINREVLLLKVETNQPAALLHKKAVANVMRNPEGYGVPTASEKGWCGLGGKPE